ncbi:hypothetical protein [Sphingobium subterraneum]|uniref:Autotransporter domain-containing protein n=1 Tax=Sphingobium subterraneum TaxID=627688 RepID=A0A841IZW7_9SPHN|nr:hypothetical protein [Sphingobium subterraneum]MBB6124137.1 hypothetical protein [Sphingobium subterraneum]
MTGTLSPVSPRMPARRRQWMNRLMSGVCVVGVAVALGTLTSGERASANGFAGTGTVSVGGADVQISSGADTVTLFNGVSVAVIDWTPTDTSASGSINFLPNGNAVQFIGTAGDFTVLNNIRPTDGNSNPLINQIIQLNGAISSTVSGATGGKVWFYTPGGFLVGSTATINVGGLVLSSSAIPDASVGAGTINFTGTANSASSITINNGASITASNTGSYVAMVAPRIVQGGTVNVNGSTAYVAAEQASISVNAGLFDIAVTTGSGDANGVVHTGTTTGPASQSNPVNSITDDQRVYMVAVPKNQVMTMLLSGTVGYGEAVSAQAESSGIVLSGGYDVAAGAIGALSTTSGTGATNINMATTRFSSKLQAAAQRNVVLQPTGTLTFEADADISAQNSVLVFVGQNAAITAQASANSTINAPVDLTLRGGTGLNGGTVSVTTSGTTAAAAQQFAGSLTVSGDLSLLATGDGDFGLGSGPTPANGPNAVGGTVSLSASGDAVVTTDGFILDASAQGGKGTVSSGNATGGTVTLAASGTSSITANTVNFDASANADPVGVNPQTGGDAAGGTITIGATGGAYHFGAVSADASAQGGTSLSGPAGDAIGGTVNIALSGGVHDWDSFFALTKASAGGSNAGTYGAATPGGGITMTVSGLAGPTTPTSLTIANFASLNANAENDIGISGGTLQAGTIAVTAQDGGVLAFNGGLSASASASETPGSLAFPGSSSDAQGGVITLLAAGGTLSADSLFLSANGTASEATTVAGNGFGGTITLSATSQNGARGALTFGDSTGFGNSSAIVADGFGGSGAVGANGRGGSVTIFAIDSDITGNGFVNIRANGTGGASVSPTGGQGGNGQGGLVIFENRTSNGTNDASMTFGTLAANADGFGTLIDEGIVYNNGNGGSGQGGDLFIGVSTGTFVADSVEFIANGYGGAVGSSTNGTRYIAGDGTGGSAGLLVSSGANPGVATLSSLTLTANGLGGDTRPGGAASSLVGIGGNGFGGGTSLQFTGGTLNSTTIRMSAVGTGTTPQISRDSNAPDGGTGTGGGAFIGGSFGTLNGDTVVMDTRGVGGEGGSVAELASTPSLGLAAGAGGDGFGGSAGVDAAAIAYNVGGITVGAAGIGGIGGQNESTGNGGAGGGGTGGSSGLIIDQFGSPVLTSITLDSLGQGGAGGLAGRNILVNGQVVFVPGQGAGGDGGSGTGGLANVTVVTDPTMDNLFILAHGIGGAGGNGATGGAGGDGFGGTGTSGAIMNLANTTLTVTGILEAGSDGTGGVGGAGFTGSGGDGGSGTGGDAVINVDGDGTVLTTNALDIHANGFGALGGASGTQASGNFNGANGGSGQGGLARLNVTNLGAVDGTAGLAILNANGSGGNGTAGKGAGNGGSGGTGTGGVAALRVDGASASFADLGLTADGIGGDGAQGGPGVPGVPNGSGGTTGGLPPGFFGSSGGYFVGKADLFKDGGTLDISGQLGMHTSGFNGGGADTGLFITNLSGPLTVGNAQLYTDTRLTLAVSGTGALNVIDDLVAYGSQGVDITHSSQTTTPGDTLAAGSINISSLGPITAGAGTILRATDFTVIQTPDRVTLDRVIGGNAITLSGDAGLDVDRITGTGTVDLASFAGTVQVRTDLATPGLVNANGRTIGINALGDIGFNSFTATNDFTLNAAGTARFVGAGTAGSIGITSSDINIGANASLTATNGLQLTARGNAAFNYIGGADRTTGYSLSGAEIGRLFAHDITINPNTQSVIGSFTVNAGTNGNLASNGQFTINSAGRMRVEGAVQFTGLASTGGLSLLAGNGIEVVTASANGGSIDLRGTGNALGGFLTLTGAAIEVGTQSAIDGITGINISTAQRDARLGQNDGLVNEEGFLRAGRITLNGSEGVYIQNSGEGTGFDLRRGFTTNSLTINTGGEIIINGRLLDSTGAFIVGIPVIAQTDINDSSGTQASGYTPGSTINGCILPGTACGIVVDEPPVETPDTFERILLPVDPPLPDKLLPTFILELGESDEIGFPPLIDEPVTGAGNEDLWERDCGGTTEKTCL